MATAILLSACDADEVFEANLVDEVPESTVSSVAYTPEVIAGTLAFRDLDDYLKGHSAITNTNEASYGKWANEIGFTSLYSAWEQAEVDFLAGRRTAAQIERDNALITVQADSTVKLRNISLAAAKTMSPTGLIIIGNEIQYKTPELYLRRVLPNRDQLVAELSRPLIPGDNDSELVFDRREQLHSRFDRTASLFCGGTGLTEWVVDPEKINTPSADRHHDTRYEIDVTITNGPPVGYRVATRFLTESESFKSRNNRYGTVHVLHIESSRQRRNGDPSTFVDFDFDYSRDGRIVTGEFPLGTFYPVNEPTATSAVNAAAMVFLEVNPGRGTSPADLQTSFLTHRGMGVGNRYLIRCQ